MKKWFFPFVLVLIVAVFFLRKEGEVPQPPSEHRTASLEKVKADRVGQPGTETRRNISMHEETRVEGIASAGSQEPAEVKDTNEEPMEEAFEKLHAAYSEFSVSPELDTIGFRCENEDIAGYQYYLDNLGTTPAEELQKSKIIRMMNACSSLYSKEYGSYIADKQQEVYESLGGSSLQERLTNDTVDEVGEDTIRDHYRLIVGGLLGTDQERYYFSMSMISRMRKDLPLLNDFMDQNGYNSYRPGPGGRDYLEVGYVEDAATLIRCSRYPVECMRESPMMNRLCLVDTLACVHDYYMYLILSQGRDRLIATYGVANFALYMAGYPPLEVRIPTLDS